MRRDNSHYFIFPEYFDKSLTRKGGRRVPLSLALEKPTLIELKLAAEKLQYSTEIRKNASFPRHWWDPKGLILVEKKEPKQQLIKNLSKTVKDFIRPALEKQKKELIKEAKRKKTKRVKPKKAKSETESKTFRLKRRR
ncbi:MAG: signal recognition particle subunit SRP19/SEC65 family protein [Candidatus Hodarchaeales archaeon]